MPSVKRERVQYSDVEDEDVDDEEHQLHEEDKAEEEEDDEQQQGPGTNLGGAAFSLFPPAAEPRQVPPNYRKGAIKKIRVHDFMTYNGTVTIDPGPRLNLVLGPNGTGKSSFVCALCIGLNGSIKNLNRSDDLCEYIRHGATSFWIEMTLSSGAAGPDYVIRRTTSKHTEKRGHEEVKRHESKWQLNRRDVPAREIDALVKKLNIQFDNLCQFLPQDRVSHFASMDSYQLLEATQRALGDATLHGQHRRLVTLSGEERVAASEHKACDERLSKLRTEQERQRRDYERFQAREKLLKEAGAFRRRAKWVEFDGRNKAMQQAMERLAERKEEVQRLEAAQEQDTKPIRECDALIAELKRAKMALQRRAQEAERDAARAARELDGLTHQLTSHETELGSLEADSKKRLADITEARRKAAEAQEALQRMPERPPQDMVERCNALLQQGNAVRQQAAELELGRNSAASAMAGLQDDLSRARARLDRMTSRKHQLLANLERSMPSLRHIRQMHAWVEQQKAAGAFRGPVYGPLALELSVSVPPGSGGSIHPNQALQHVESTCWQWLGAFITTCREDNEMLTEAAPGLQCPHVRVAMSGHNPAQPYNYQYGAGRAQEHMGYGILHTVDELISAPPTVMHVLATQCGVDRVFIGSNHAASSMTAIGDNTRISTVLVGGAKYSVIRSRYAANQRSIEQTMLYAGKVLVRGSGAEEDAARAELQQEIAMKEQELEALRREFDEVDRRIKQLEAQSWEAGREAQELQDTFKRITDKRTQAKATADRCARQLVQKEAVPDPETRRPQIRAAIEKVVEKHLATLRHTHGCLQAMWQLSRHVAVKELGLQEAAAQLTALKSGSEARRAELEAAREALEGARGSHEARKREAARVQQEAAAMGEMSPEEMDAVQACVRDAVPVAQLLREAEAKEAEAEGMDCRNDNVAREFRRRQDEIGEQERKLEAATQRLDSIRREVQDLKAQWLPEIQAMVGIINQSFSANFARIGCAGEVRLREAEEFDKYAIEIAVQFRPEEPLSVLNGQRQSGGERSVCTMLYLLALQNVTDTPFRVVDEINQGMDEFNERKIFNQLVAASSQKETPQCFLLTPKLLSGLKYSHDITVLLIQNGPSVDASLPAKFNMQQGFFGELYAAA